MKVAIIGSRPQSVNESDVKAKIKDVISKLPKDTLIISGGAAGADTWGVEEAKRQGLAEPLVYRALWDDLSHPDALIKTNSYGKQYDARAGHRRNTLIVQDADLVYAFWDGKSPGTRDSITKARKMGKDVIIVQC